MSSRNRGAHAGRSRDDHLRYGAAALAYVVAGLHLFHPQYGFGRLVLVLATDPGLLASDPRPLLFVLSGLVLVVGVPAVAYSLPERPAYLAGIAFASTYAGGYFAWHFSGHGGFLPGREPLYHGLQPHEAVISHLTGDPWAAVAVVAELLLVAVLAALFWRTG